MQIAIYQLYDAWYREEIRISGSFIGRSLLMQLVLDRMFIAKNVTGAIGIATHKQKCYPRYGIAM